MFVHRWFGVYLCTLFFLWFTSGIVMMYWSFPEVTAEDRLERSPALIPSTIHLSPTEASARLDLEQPPAQVRLNTFDGRPVYRFAAGRTERIIFADTGEEQALVSPSMIDRIAAAWTGQPVTIAKVESLEDVDQWTVQEGVRRLQPFQKYSWPNGEQVYVSGVTGEVAQYTTSASRFWSYLGPIPHWLYFTPLRKYGPQWSQVVMWTSGIGTIAAILGIVIGLWITGNPYRGAKRWHMLLGLIFGWTTATWAFSGLLSMEPVPAKTVHNNIEGQLRGRFQIAEFNAKHPREALAQIADLAVKELELTSFAGEPVYLATMAHGETRVIPVHGAPMAGFDPDRIISLVTGAARILSDYDAYYLDRRHKRPLPVILVKLDDGTRYYIDPKTARVVGIYDSGAWITRWLYHGLHSLDFPWLYRYRPLWDIVVISLLLGGCALSVTSLMLAWRVLRGQ